VLTCIVKGHPPNVESEDMIHYFVEHRHDVVIRRTRFELRKAEEKTYLKD
jgi:DNA gyrase subunit A